MKNIPKKAKLISSGGFYKIIKLENFTHKLIYPIHRKIKIIQPELDWNETAIFNLEFVFTRVYRGYAEFRQVDEIRIK